MQVFEKTAGITATVALGLLIGSGTASAIPGHGYGKYNGPTRSYYAHRYFRGYHPYGRYGYQRPYQAYGRYAPYAYNAYDYPGQGIAHPGHADDAKPRSQGAGYSDTAKMEGPKKTAEGNGETRVDIANMRFSPTKIAIKAGETGTWAQLANMPHTVTANDGSFDSPTLGQNRQFSVTFDKPGSYSYYCKIHPSMKGEVEVL